MSLPEFLGVMRQALHQQLQSSTFLLAQLQGATPVQHPQGGAIPPEVAQVRIHVRHVGAALAEKQPTSGSLD